ncbi:AraC family transcriptional regulator [Gordoniibacillus kamchatkensis]|uniref:AraC family transcriptional regulator n=1 Tax=Gordoniibacillus kamchatkensis TaxID=1590651 RepID=A0ABR5ACZ9_9BACL|nr:response regulator [Paenibacillus sp. VKM B-2647]KIL38936.1 AraC family transcriptional regulator [Paenibacillus sp. VKM B-2647]
MAIKILLVEDEDIIRTGLKSIIAQLSGDFEVAGEAAHGKEALDYLQKEMPDLIVTDIRMREMDGLTLAAKVRERYPHMPILIISGHGDFEYARQAIRYGVSDYLLKPIDRLAFVTALENVRRRLEPALAARPGQAESENDAEERTVKGDDGRRLIRKVKEYIQANPDKDLRLQTLAEVVNLNPAYLSQLFKQETKVNLSDFITEVRIDRAKYLLANTDLKIYDVARLAGYQSPKHFMLVFKQLAGTTPGAYREEAQPQKF